MTAEEIIAKIQADSQVKALQKKLSSGSAEFADTWAYQNRVSDLLGEYLSANMLSTPAYLRKELCQSLLKQSYDNINSILEQIQEEIDSRQGLHLRSQHAPYPAERVQQIGNSLEDATVPDETIKRRARAGTANISKAFHDSYMQENAKFRSSAGLKCYITRDGASKCCEWCAEVAGKFEYKDAPDGVFRRHDNCTCTVYYDTSRTRQTLCGAVDTDGRRTKTWEVIDEVPRGFEPTVFTDETRPQGFVPTVLTPSAKSGTIRLTDMFHKDGDDPMFEVTGRAIDSNPREVSEMISRLQEWGVSIHRGQSTLGYGCIRNGEPGAMSITDDASFSAWRHEFDHAEQDRAAGWNGVQVLWFDPAERERRERSAYAIEIQLARDAGREDIVERLEANRDAEIEKIWHDYYERFGYPD